MKSLISYFCLIMPVGLWIAIGDGYFWLYQIVRARPEAAITIPGVHTATVGLRKPFLERAQVICSKVK
ncbi:MAG TPA: hypothetical protein PKD05_04850 [Candidatus Melainabacteria bacterium]|nr:hypothetical protein [Candidatus Melainabacteria bacterium]